MAYQCAELERLKNIYGSYDCASWVEVQPSLLNQFSNLTLEEAGLLFSATAALFTVAWVFSRLSFFTRLKH